MLNEIESTCAEYTDCQDSPVFQARIDSIFNDFKSFDKTRIFSTIPLPKSHMQFLENYPTVLNRWLSLRQRSHRRAEKVHLLKYPQDAWQATDAFSFFEDNLFLQNDQRKFNLSKNSTSVVTFGSCFAENISTSLIKQGVDCHCAPMMETFNNPIINEQLLKATYNNDHSGTYSVNVKDSFSQALHTYDQQLRVMAQLLSSQIGTFLEYVPNSQLIVFTLGTAFLPIDRTSGQVIPFAKQRNISTLTHQLVDIPNLCSSIQNIYRILRISIQLL